MMRFTLKSTVAPEAIFKATHIMKQMWYSLVNSYLLQGWYFAPFSCVVCKLQFYGCLPLVFIFHRVLYSLFWVVMVIFMKVVNKRVFIYPCLYFKNWCISMFMCWNIPIPQNRTVREKFTGIMLVKTFPFSYRIRSFVFYQLPWTKLIQSAIVSLCSSDFKN